MLHVVWDWNGTLFDDLHVVVDAVNAVMQTAELPTITAEQYRDGYTRPVKAFYENLYGRGIADDEWDVLDHVFHEAYRTGLHAAGLRKEAEIALDVIDDLGGTQSILSMWRHHELLPLVDELGITKRFILIDGLKGPGGGFKAPHLEDHLRRLAHSWDDTVSSSGREADLALVVIGDAVDDAHAAIAHDCRAVLVDNGSHPRWALEETGVPVATDLLEALRMAELL